MLVELLILVAIATKPVAGIVVPFICKAHRHTIVAKRPDLLDQPILQIANPLAYEECLDGLAAKNELGAVTPDAIHRIGNATLEGSRLFQSSAIRTFCAAVSV